MYGSRNPIGNFRPVVHNGPMSTTRSGKLELAILMFACVWPTAVTLAYYVIAPSMGAEPESVQGVYVAAKATQFVLPLAWVYGICREPVRRFRWNSRGLGIGLAFGLLAAASIWSGYHFIMSGTTSFNSAEEKIREKVADVGLMLPWKYIAVGAFYTLFHSLLEEYYWRWFVFGRMRNWMTVPSAIPISSLAFMAHHVLLLGLFFGWTSPLVWLFSFGVMVGGAFWAWLYNRSGSLWGPWLSHALIDAAIFVVGYQLTFG